MRKKCTVKKKTDEGILMECEDEVDALAIQQHMSGKFYTEGWWIEAEGTEVRAGPAEPPEPIPAAPESICMRRGKG